MKNGKCVFPGGSFERNEKPLICLIRELKEETNCKDKFFKLYDLSSIKPIEYRYDSQENITRLDFLFLTELKKEGSEKCLFQNINDPEIKKTFWLDLYNTSAVSTYPNVLYQIQDIKKMFTEQFEIASLHSQGQGYSTAPVLEQYWKKRPL